MEINVQGLINDLTNRVDRNGLKVIDHSEDEGCITIIPKVFDFNADIRNVPLIADVRMICNNHGIDSDNIAFHEYGVDIYLPYDDFWNNEDYGILG